MCMYKNNIDIVILNVVTIYFVFDTKRMEKSSMKLVYPTFAQLHIILNRHHTYIVQIY